MGTDSAHRNCGTLLVLLAANVQNFIIIIFSLTKYSQTNATKIVLVERRPSHTALTGFCLFLNTWKIQTALKNLRHSLSSGFMFYLVILSKRHAFREMLYKIINAICPERDSIMAPPEKNIQNPLFLIIIDQCQICHFSPVWMRGWGQILSYYS